ncbi:MAG: DUF1385 domain-containing protein [bacterium]
MKENKHPGSASPRKRIGGVSSRFGVGILYDSRISFSTRLKNGQIATFSQDTSNCSGIYRVPFLRSLLVFRQVILIFLLARRNLVKLAKEGLVDLQRGKRLIHGILFLVLYFGFFTFVEPYLNDLVPVLRWIIFVGALILLIRSFFYLVLGDQSLKYHGAEHKVINTFLAGDNLVIPATQRYSRFAFRCGTTLATLFILLELLIPESAYQALSQHFGPTAGVFLVFFLLLGLAYETLAILSKKEPGKVLSLFTILISKMQLLTTREPSSKELEVALSAIREAVGWHPSSVDDYIFTSGLPEGYQ